MTAIMCNQSISVIFSIANSLFTFTMAKIRILFKKKEKNADFFSDHILFHTILPKMLCSATKFT